MNTEIEAKWLDIDSKKFREKLNEVGATLVHAEVLMRRKNFDYPDKRLMKVGGWIRVRDEGDKITLSYKQLNDRSLHGTQEVEVTVDNFNRTCELLTDIGLEAYTYQETKRESWELSGADITIDTWPWIPTFVEIEGSSEKLVHTVAGKLDLNWERAVHGSVETVYQKHYDFTEEEIDGWSEITFISPPTWLLNKKIL